MAVPSTIRLPDEPRPNPFDSPITIDLGEPKSAASMENGVLKTENADGSLTVDFEPKTEGDNSKTGWFSNLAEKIDESELSRIASELLTGIDSDDRSRTEWLETRAKGLTLLGFKIEDPKTDVATTSAPMDGMATIRHPLLAEAVIRFQANARGELLPATGPVKVRNDTPTKPFIPQPPGPAAPPPAPPPGGPPSAGAAPVPQPPMPGAPGQPPMMPGPGAPLPPNTAPPQANGSAIPGAPVPPMQPPMPLLPAIPEFNNLEETASALELDMNHYLTAVATEYYPDTDRMLFWIGLGGQGFKKVHHCPIRQRPVSESVDAEDLIVSNAAATIEDCGRITHRIKMRPSILRRMQLVEAYRDVPISPAPSTPDKNVVDKKKDEIQGIHPQPQLTDDTDHIIYECYCELDIKGFEHKKGSKTTGLRCPYKVTIHKESRQVLEVRRLWEKGDELCMPKQFFVEFPFVRAMGFYGLGLVHIAGNTTNTLTAAWREMLDAGMFANFPGFLFNKMLSRQLTNQFRIPPGGGMGIDIGNMPIGQAVMPLPYKEPGPAFTAFLQHVEEVGQRVAGTAEITIGEGKQEVPVGTTLAMIEQATKVMDSVHKRLHAAQAMEFKLLKQRFKEDPEAFWRHNKKPTIPWKKEQFIQALDNNELVPVADPNNPTSLHRVAKATAIKALQQANPAIYDAKAVDTRIMRIVGIDPEGLFAAQPAQPPPDPRIVTAQMKAQTDQAMGQLKIMELQLKAALSQQEMGDKAQDRASRERLEQMAIDLEKLRILEEQIIHGREQHADDTSGHLDTIMKYKMHADKLAQDFEKHKMSVAAQVYDTNTKKQIAEKRPPPGKASK